MTIAELASIRDTETLNAEQIKTLETPRRKYGLLAKGLFWFMDFFYGEERNFSKFKVLEVIARVPYQAWEHVGYIAMTHTYPMPKFARRIFEFVQESRAQQDNEQWHLFILQELIQKKGIKENVFMFLILPQMMAFIYYHISWLLYVMKPGWSYALNADFEDHAEHEYMYFAKDNPAFDNEAFESEFKSDYGNLATLTDLLIRIGIDERMHKEESIVRMQNPRFSASNT